MVKRHFSRNKIEILVGGFKYCLFSPLLGEDANFDSCFSDGWFNHQLEIPCLCLRDHEIIPPFFFLGGIKLDCKMYGKFEEFS